MSDNRKKETSNISHPWDPGGGSAGKIVCPKCGNDGMDGSIHGRGGQWSVQRKCMKPNEETGKICGHKWTGTIAVQRVDVTQPLPIKGVLAAGNDDPIKNDVHQPFRDPSKSRDYDED